MLQRAMQRYRTVQLTQSSMRSFAPPKKGGPPMAEASKPLIEPIPKGENEFQKMVSSGEHEFIFGPPDGMNKPLGAHRNRIIHKLEPRI